MERFEEGKRYRFKKELFDKADKIEVTDRTWHILLDNREVEVVSEKMGWIDDLWCINPIWCEEIKDEKDNSMFKIGDEVKFKKGLEIGEEYNGIIFINFMKEKNEVNGIVVFVDEDNTVKVAFDDKIFWLGINMIELVNK